jgi:predicted phosphodiesterase
VRYLILSDIHSNWEALEAVVDASKGLYEKVICLGDLVGYGADPNLVVDWVRTHANVVIRGNHDKACSGMEGLQWFNEIARDAALWTLRALSPENLTYLVGLRRGPLELPDMTLVHGSILDEDEYVVAPREAAQVFPYLDGHVTFFGHTHLQGGFAMSGSALQIIRPKPDQCPQYLDVQETEKYLLNPGSVGQPRDGDSRVGFLIYDSEQARVVYYRLEYDLNKAQQKIIDAGLPEHLAARLSVGR